jgi:hypothetical protein
MNSTFVPSVILTGRRIRLMQESARQQHLRPMRRVTQKSLNGQRNAGAVGGSGFALNFLAPIPKTRSHKSIT